MTCKTLRALSLGFGFLFLSQSVSAQSVFEQIGEGVKHLANEVDKAARDITPFQVDFRQGGRIILNGPTQSLAIDPATGRTITTSSPAARFVQNLPGQAMFQAVMMAKGAIRTAYPLPPDLAQDLISVGVAPQIVQMTRWSPDWYVTNYLPGTGNQGAVTLEDIVVVRDNRLVGDRAFMAHELRHVLQYQRLGTQEFATQYTLNAWVFENEAKDEQARVERAMIARNSAGPGFSLQQPAQQQFAYFNVMGQFLYGDANGMLYPADPNSGRVLGPANGRIFVQNGQFVAVDSYGRSFAAQRIR
jgi:hypothetical protein